MTENRRRTIAPGERIVGHLPAKALDPLSEQIHRQYRERQDDLKARYARIKPAESVPAAASISPALGASTAEPASPAATAPLSAAEEAEDAWLASLVADYRASKAAENVEE